MQFEVGKSYGGYVVESRIKCFVTFENLSRKKIFVSEDGVEQVKFDGTSRVYGNGSKTEIEAFTIAAFEAPSANEIVDPQPVRGWGKGEDIVIKDYHGQEWQLVSVGDETCVFEAVEHREIGYAPRIRTMPLPQVQALFGWDKEQKEVGEHPYFETTIEEVSIAARSLGYFLELDDKYGWKVIRDDGARKTGRLHQILLYLEAERHSMRHDIHIESILETCYDPKERMYSKVVRQNLDQCGYAKAVPIPEPSWFYDADECPPIDLDLESQRMQEIYDRECDRATMGIPLSYGASWQCGGVL